METPEDKRKIDDPELNQDSTYDRKAEEDFDNSDDFHKYDDTALDGNSDITAEESEEQQRANDLNSGANPLNSEGKFDGIINI